MNKFFRGAIATALIASSLAACTPAEKKKEVNENGDLAAVKQYSDNYLSKADAKYSFDFAKSLEQFKTNEKLGYRTAGSEAELKTGELIADEMKKIGLTDVSKDEFTVDSWTFEKADMTFKTTDGKEKMAVLGAYQTNFDTKGTKEFDVVYANRGTADDLKDLNIKGKLVLVDVNQRDDWWISYPAYQAHLKGAAAVVTVQSEGYSEVDGDALNAQDICGPEDAPAFSISQNDAKELKKSLKANNNKLTVNFDAKSTVKLDQPTYNYYGKIEGKDPESYIILSAHYDSYFDGFQDDNAAIALMMGVAKGLVDSDYKPEKTIIFNALAAEEWGVSNTRYDWSTGAYNQIFRIHPEWVGKAFADMNFELPAYEHTTTNEIRADYELKNFLTKFTKSVPSVDGVYKDGISVVSPLRTWSDDFSFSIAGVPSLRNDFQDSEFMQSHYHTQYDNEDTYNGKALEFHLNLYGLLAMHYDQTAVTPLDFTTRLDALKDSIKLNVFKDTNISSKELTAAIDATSKTAKDINTQVEKINAAYTKALVAGDDKEVKKLYDDSRSLNSSLLATYKYAQDQFVRLTWEDEPILPHEHAQNNIINLQGAIKALEKGDASKALDDYLLAIDNNWYGYSFDKEVFDYFTNYVLDQPADRLMWGAGRIMGHEDLYDTVASLKKKRDQKNAVVSKELSTLNAALKRQKTLLKTSVEDEVKSVQELNKQLKKMK